MSAPKLNPWKVLGVHLQSDDSEIRAAYVALARVHHPDKGGDAAVFSKIAESYSLLTDRKKRSTYIKDLSVWHECCPACKGKGIFFKQRGLVGREVRACSTCGGAGVIIEEKGYAKPKSDPGACRKQ